MQILESLFGRQYNKNNFFLLAGPCVVENESVVMETATALQQICNIHSVPFVFKSSFKKANRTSANSYTGIGMQQALAILQTVKDQLQLPIVTDVHSIEEIEEAAKVADVLQIPAFLCRQTDLLLAAAATGKFVNIKKGQFLNAHGMQHAQQKIIDAGNNKVMLTERGNSFGYTDLVVDFRNIPIMKGFGAPVIMDCTHAVQQPNQANGVTGGTPQYVETMAKCAIAAGADGLFIETHPKPSEAKSDGANMLALAEMPALIEKLVPLYKIINN